MKNIFLKFAFSNLINKTQNDLPLLPERMKESKSLLLIYMIKLNMLSHKTIKASFKPWANVKTQSD